MHKLNEMTHTHYNMLLLITTQPRNDKHDDILAPPSC